MTTGLAKLEEILFDIKQDGFRHLISLKDLQYKIRMRTEAISPYSVRGYEDGLVDCKFLARKDSQLFYILRWHRNDKEKTPEQVEREYQAELEARAVTESENKIKEENRIH